MKVMTRKDFGRKTAHAVFRQMGILFAGFILTFALMFHLFGRDTASPAAITLCMFLDFALIAHFLLTEKYCRHIRTTAQISKLAGIDQIAVVSCEQIQKKRKQWQNNWDSHPRQFQLIAPLCWVNRHQNCFIAGQAAYAGRTGFSEGSGLHLADYAVRDDLIELGGMLCTVPGYLEFLGLLFSRTKLKPPVPYKKGPAEKGFI